MTTLPPKKDINAVLKYARMKIPKFFDYEKINNSEDWIVIL